MNKFNKLYLQLLELQKPYKNDEAHSVWKELNDFIFNDVNSENVNSLDEDGNSILLKIINLYLVNLTCIVFHQCQKSPEKMKKISLNEMTNLINHLNSLGADFSIKNKKDQNVYSILFRCSFSDSIELSSFISQIKPLEVKNELNCNSKVYESISTLKLLLALNPSLYNLEPINRFKGLITSQNFDLIIFFNQLNERRRIRHLISN